LATDKVVTIQDLLNSELVRKVMIGSARLSLAGLR